MIKILLGIMLAMSLALLLLYRENRATQAALGEAKQATVTAVQANQESQKTITGLTQQIKDRDALDARRAARDEATKVRIDTLNRRLRDALRHDEKARAWGATVVPPAYDQFVRDGAADGRQDGAGGGVAAGKAPAAHPGTTTTAGANHR